MKPGERPLVVGVPDLPAYQPHTGIGRVFCTISSLWRDRVQLVNARFEALPLPVLRSLPFAVRASEKVDLVLLPKLTGAQALRNTFGVPSVAIVHDIGIIDFPGDRAGTDWLTYQIVSRSFWGLRHASHIITVSRFTRDRLLYYLPDLEPKVSVIPNPINSIFLDGVQTRTEAREQIGQMVGNPLAGPVLIYVGSEAPRKNIPLLLQVVSRVKELHPDAKLLKVGSSGFSQWRAKTLSDARNLGLHPGKDILILEGLDDTTLAAAYRAADVFISTSLYEGFGLPALEAMAIGTPIVVTNRGSFPEIVGSAGRTVEPTLNHLVRAVDDSLAEQQNTDRVLYRRAHAANFKVEAAAGEYLSTMEAVAIGDATTHERQVPARRSKGENLIR